MTACSATMGIFAAWQPRYAAHRIATFPVHDKRPAVTGYLKLGLEGSRRLTEKFSDADAIGFALGKQSGITVLDVDTNDERMLAVALDRHGQTRIVVRSGSGNYQAWYHWNGEKRLIRSEPDKPIDILGRGFVVAPPSHGTKSDYQFVQGGLDDLDRLPILGGFGTALPRVSPATCPVEIVTEGQRNVSLWRHCMQSAHHCDDFDALLDVARTRNAEFTPPLLDDEVVKIATSASRYTERNENWFGFGRRVAFPHATVDRLAAQDPYALALLSVLKRLHGGRDHFILAKEAAHRLGWSFPAFKAARKRLEDEGEIRCISRGGRGAHDPPRYTWKQGVRFRTPI
jgi:hypothetical protein